MLQESILKQYFPPALSYHLSFKTFVLSIFEWPLKTGFTVSVSYLILITDMKILKDMSRGETDMTRLGELIGNHGALLKQAMKCKLTLNCIVMVSSTG